MSPTADNQEPFALAYDSRCDLGESPVWSEAEQALYFVDIRGPTINRFDPSNGSLKRFTMSEDIGCIGLARGGGFIAGTRSGLWSVSPDGEPRHMLAANPQDHAAIRFNDGKVGPDGRFYVGTVDEGRNRQAALYRYDRNGLAALVNGVMTSNGLAFSPDGSVLYHVDSPTSTVMAYAFSAETGEIAAPRSFVRVPDTPFGPSRPDGSAVDAEGCYWIALFGAAAVQRYSPAGKLLETHAVPVQCPTMVGFGGHDLRTLFVTTARSRRPPEEIERFPLSGGLFAKRVPVPGLAPHLFDDAA